MTLGIKLLVGGISLAAASGGGYVVYKKILGSSAETDLGKKITPSEDATNTDSGTGETSPEQKNQTENPDSVRT